MTNYMNWDKYDVSKELDTLKDRDFLDEILAPYKKMLKDASVVENDVRVELSKFSKSMKSLAKVAKLKLKSKLIGVPPDSPAYLEANESVDLLLRLSDEIGFADTEYISILERVGSLTTSVLAERNSSGLAALQALVVYSERVQGIKGALQEDFAKISVVLNMSEDVVTAVLQKLWLVIDNMVSQLMCVLAYSTYAAGETAISLEVGRFYLKKYSNMTNQRVQAPEGAEVAIADAAGLDPNNPLTLPMQALLKKEVLRNTSEGMLVKHAMVWIVRCLGFLEIGCPYLARVHANCIKTLLRKQPETDGDGEEDPSMYGYATQPPPQAPGGLSTMYIFPNILNIASMLEQHELQYAAQQMRLTRAHVDEGAGGSATVLAPLCNELTMLTRRVQSERKRLLQDTEGRPGVELGEFVTIATVGDVLQSVYDVDGSLYAEVQAKVTQDADGNGGSDANFVIEEVAFARMASGCAESQSIDSDMLLAWAGRVYYEAQVLYLESFFLAAQLKYFATVLLVNVWMRKFHTLGTDRALVTTLSNWYHCSLLNISTCIFHRNQVQYSPVGSDTYSRVAELAQSVPLGGGSCFVLLPVRHLTGLSALNLVDWCLQYHPSPHPTHTLATKWRRALVLEALWKFGDARVEVQGCLDLVEEEVGGSCGVSRGQGVASTRYGFMFTQEHLVDPLMSGPARDFANFAGFQLPGFESDGDSVGKSKASLQLQVGLQSKLNRLDYLMKTN